MQEAIELIKEHPWILRLAASILVVPVVFILRNIALKWVKNAPIKSADLRRRWMGSVQQISVVAAIGLVLLIWATLLQSLALSLVAVAAAIVVATKELLLCLIGGMVKASTGLFTLGDRVEINGIRGEVIEQGLLSTRLMEIGPGKDGQQYTGRNQVVPNAWFLAHTLVNETAASDFELHTFVVPIANHADWDLHETWLLTAAQDACTDHLEDARKALDRYAERRFMDKFSVSPRVTLAIPDPNRIDLVVRIPAPTGLESKLQRQIIRQYLQAKKQHTQAEEQKKAATETA